MDYSELMGPVVLNGGSVGLGSVPAGLLWVFAIRKQIFLLLFCVKVLFCGLVVEPQALILLCRKVQKEHGGSSAEDPGAGGSVGLGGSAGSLFASNKFNSKYYFNSYRAV